MARRFSRLESRILNKPLMIEPSAGELVLSAVGERLGLDVRSEDFAHEAKERESKSYAVVDGIAIIPVLGELVRRGSWIDAMSGLTSYASIANTFDKALADKSVSAILFDIDSPGGEAGGVMDLSDRIYNARGTKPIYASVNELAASAAYAIASAADKVFVSRTGTVGSIGVIAFHVDRSQADAKAGFKYTPIFAGDRKADLSPHAPLSDDARAWIEDDVQKHYKLFTETVARNRGLDVQAVVDTEAALYMGEDGIEAGLADEIATFEESFSRVRESMLNPDDEESDEYFENEGDKDLEKEGNNMNEKAVIARASKIADLCAQAGLASHASRFINSEASIDDVEQFIEQKSEVKAVVQQASFFKADDAEKRAIIDKCRTPDEARKMIFERMCAADEALEIDSSAPRTGSLLSAAQTETQVSDIYTKWKERKPRK